MRYVLAVLRRNSGTRLPELEAVLPPPSDDGWDDLTLRLARHEHDVEVVLLAWVNKDLFTERAELEDLIDRIREHVLGASIALALVTDGKSSKLIVDQAASVHAWLNTPIQRGVVDFVELPEEKWDKEDWDGDLANLPGGLLRRSLDNCHENLRRLLKTTGGVVPLTSWRIRYNSHRLNRLFADHQTARAGDGVRITVVDVAGARDQVALVAKEQLVAPASAAEVVALLRSNEKPELRELRKQYEIGPPLEFSTELEALYFARALESLQGAPDLSRRMLLLSHAFDPDDDPSLVIAASQDIGTVLRAVGPRATTVVVRRNTPERLATSLALLPANTRFVWVHLGHGVAAALETPDGALVDADTWLNVFRGSGRELVASVLLACHSSDLATALRTGLASMQCCFGFTGELAEDDARRFAGTLLPALLQGVSNKELQASYQQALANLKAAGSKAEPFVSPSSLV